MPIVVKNRTYYVEMEVAPPPSDLAIGIAAEEIHGGARDHWWQRERARVS